MFTYLFCTSTLIRYMASYLSHMLTYNMNVDIDKLYVDIFISHLNTYKLSLHVDINPVLHVNIKFKLHVHLAY